MHNSLKRLKRQCLGQSPFKGSYLPSRVKLFALGRPSWPFPHYWNYRDPIRILDTYFFDVDNQSLSGQHNRYLDVLGAPTVLVSRDRDIIKAILFETGDKPGQFDRDTGPTAGIGRATGEDSLLYANGTLWREQKKLASGPFGKTKLFQPEKFSEFEQTFRNTVADRLDLLRAEQIASNQTITRVELESEISAVMLEMLINNFFGASISYEDIREKYVPSLTFMIDHMVSDTIKHELTSRFKFLVRPNKALEKAQSDFEELTQLALAGRAEGLGLWKQFKSDVSDDALRSNIMVFLAGALEATTSFASWTITHLARSPEYQEKIYEEVKSMDIYVPENLAQAVNLKKVLEETLRLTPALYFLPRKATVDTWIETPASGNMLIPKGTHILLDVWHANRTEEFWGVENSGFPAAQFAPARWDILKDKGYSPKEMLHFGFGFGPRTCPGISLGLLEVSLVVGAFVKMFKFTAPGERVEPVAGVSTKPADGVLVDLELRD